MKGDLLGAAAFLLVASTEAHALTFARWSQLTEQARDSYIIGYYEGLVLSGFSGDQTDIRAKWRDCISKSKADGSFLSGQVFALVNRKPELSTKEMSAIVTPMFGAICGWMEN